MTIKRIICINLMFAKVRMSIAMAQSDVEGFFTFKLKNSLMLLIVVVITIRHCTSVT